MRVAAPAVRAPVADTIIRDPTLTLAELEQRIAANHTVERDRMLDSALPAMVERNPGEVARFAELQSDPYLREIMLRQVAQTWAKNDVEQAIAWARSLPEASERDAALIDVSLSVALTDPQRAVSLREQDAGNVEPDGVLEGLVQQWAEKDFDAAHAWTNARPGVAQRDQLLQRLVFVRAKRGDHTLAAQLANDAIDASDTRDEALAIVAQQIDSAASPPN